MSPPFEERLVEASDGLRLMVRDYSGEAGRTPVLCLPGLSRCRRDFEPLAGWLAPSRRVLCLDMRGRGGSDRDPEGASYAPVSEAADALRALDALGIPRVVAVGTSRGGLNAMIIAAMRPTALAGAVLNDVGPQIERAGLLRIVAGLSATPETFRDWAEATAAIRSAHGRFFPDLTDAAWDAFARRLFAERDGRPARDFDPRIARVAETALGEELPTLWPQFEALAACGPVLAVRGARSDILSAETLAEMARRVPAMRAVTLPGRGHAPFLDEPEAVAAIRALLEEVDAACATQTPPPTSPPSAPPPTG